MITKHFNRIQRLDTSADYVTDMFTDRQMVSEGNTKHFDGSYSAYIGQNRWCGEVRLSSAVSDDNFNGFSYVETEMTTIVLLRPICYRSVEVQQVPGRDIRSPQLFEEV